MDHRPESKTKTVKLMEDNIGENQRDLRFGNDFLDISSKSWSRNERTDKVNPIKIKSFISAKGSEEMKRQATEWKKIFVKAWRALKLFTCRFCNKTKANTVPIIQSKEIFSPHCLYSLPITKTKLPQAHTQDKFMWMENQLFKKIF